MANLSIEEMRQDLVERREALRAELLEVEKGLKGLEDALSAHQKVTKKSTAPPAPPTVTIDTTAMLALVGTKDKYSNTQQVYETIQVKRDWGKFDPARITPEVNLLFGQNLDQEQVSLAMRNLHKSGKLALVTPGKPRKPAVYALPGTPDAAEAEAGTNEETEGANP